MQAPMNLVSRIRTQSFTVQANRTERGRVGDLYLSILPSGAIADVTGPEDAHFYN